MTSVASLPKLVDEEAERGRADPFVVALARVQGGSVVTGERPAEASSAPFRIPGRVRALRASLSRRFGFLRGVGWQL